MNEDDLYRSSSQFRLWSFTESDLARLRSATNESATTRVREAFSRLSKAENGTSAAEEIDCLTVEEEAKLVTYYCMQAMDFADFCGFPTVVKATAVQYLKRFYISNSPMTYHPKQITPSAQFLATKTENFYTRLKDFAKKLPNTTPEAVIAPEFLLVEGLRFTFDVRHPFRGLEGGVMELHALAEGSYVPPAGASTSSKELQTQILNLADQSGQSTGSSTPEQAQKRLEVAHGQASQLLKTSALLTDAYFLYTPAQIWLAALFVADEPLTTFYIHVLLSAAKSESEAAFGAIRRCAQLLSSSSMVKPSAEQMEELRRIDKKLYKCRNPEKIDLVEINQQEKRNGQVDAESDEQRALKKRKLEREGAQREGDDIFGPSLQA